MVCHRVFSQLWQRYRNRVPQVSALEDLLRERNEIWQEDHVAFRTLPGQHCGARILQDLFEQLGYSRQEDLYFEDKQLNAFWLAPPPTEDLLQTAPKIFVSELIPHRFSAAFQEVLRRYTETVVASPLAQWAGLKGEALIEAAVAYLKGRPWQRPSYRDYEILRAESEYAAWTLVFGNQVNHFTVSIYLMQRFGSLAQFNEFVGDQLGIPMNTSGGLIKGSAACGLEQSATLAAQLPILFQEGIWTLPYAFVEFCWRHPRPGKIADAQWSSYYQGFVVSNADKIFDSTNVILS